jgi:hypothetical protein
LEFTAFKNELTIDLVRNRDSGNVCIDFFDDLFIRSGQHFVRSGQQFIRIGDEIEEGVEVGLIFPFVEAVKKGTFFGAGFILLFLFDEQFCGEDFSAEVAVIEPGIVDAFVKDLELWDGETRGQQFKEYGVQGSLVAELTFCDIDHIVVVEDEVGHLLQVEPFGVIFCGELAGVLVDIDECEVSDADGTFDWIAVGFAEGIQLFQVDAFEAGKFLEDSVCGLVEAFAGLEESAHQAPVPFAWLKPALDEQKFYIGPVEPEDDTVDGDE